MIHFVQDAISERRWRQRALPVFEQGVLVGHRLHATDKPVTSPPRLEWTLRDLSIAIPGDWKRLARRLVRRTGVVGATALLWFGTAAASWIPAERADDTLGALLITILTRGPRGGNAAPNTGSGNVVEAPLYDLPRKENGDEIAYNCVTDAPTENMWDYVTVPTVTGTTHTPANASEFTTDVTTDSARGDEIVLTAGTTYTLNDLAIPTKSGSGWITVRTANAATNLPVGTRVLDADLTDMATIRSTTTNGSIMHFNASASHWRFIGINFTHGSASNVENSLVSLGSSEGGWTTWATAPSNICFDRCRFEGGAAGTRRGVGLGGANIAFTECHFDGFTDTGASDSQNILGIDRSQRTHINNCYLGAASEHIMFGGSTPDQLSGSYADTHPIDIMITRCEFAGDGSTTLNRKNLFEIKNGERILLWGCVFHGYRLGQGTHSCLFILSCQEGNAAVANYTHCRHITFRSCWIYDVEGTIIRPVGNNGTPVNDVAHHIEFGYCYGWDYATGGTSDGGVIDHLVSECYEITYRNLMFRGWPHHVTRLDTSGATPLPDFGPRLYNSAFPTNSQYGYFTATALNTLYGTNNWQFSHLASIDAISEHQSHVGGTPDNTGTIQTLANVAAFGFTDSATDDYSLAGGSPLLNAGSDGRDIGGHWATFQTNTSGVVTG